VVTACKFLVNDHPAVVLFDSGASHFFVSSTFASDYKLNVITIAKGGYCISAARNNIMTNQVVKDVKIEIGDREFLVDLIVLPGVGIDVILGMKWMSGNGVLIDTSTHVVMLRDPIDKKGFQFNFLVISLSTMQPMLPYPRPLRIYLLFVSF
jgi:hypothetical protein